MSVPFYLYTHDIILTIKNKNLVTNIIFELQLKYV